MQVYCRLMGVGSVIASMMEHAQTEVHQAFFNCVFLDYIETQPITIINPLTDEQHFYAV